jgi:hypothetical protein
MKNNYFLLLILGIGVLTTTACKKKAETIPIELSFANPFPTPEITTTDSLIVFETFRFPTAIDDALKSQNTSKDLLKEAILEEMQMDIVFPTDANFNFLKQIEVFMIADGLPEKLNASLMNIPRNVRTIQLLPSGKSMHEYLKKSEVSLIIKMVLNEPLSQGTIINIRTKYKGKAGVL